MSKTILITGAAGELGQWSAATLSQAGHRVFASMRDPSGRNREQANALWARSIHVLAMDVTRDESVDRGVRDVLAKVGHLDAVVHHARLRPVEAAAATRGDQLALALETNVCGLFRVIRAVLLPMQQAGGGLVIHIGSLLGQVCLPRFAVYGASMAAAEHLMQAVRGEVSSLGIDLATLRLNAGMDGLAQTSAQPVITHEDLIRFGHALFELMDAPAPRPEQMSIAPSYGVEEAIACQARIQELLLRGLTDQSAQE